jgi:signal transduction histidine kinase/Flp pilus assembly protein TadD
MSDQKTGINTSEKSSILSQSSLEELLVQAADMRSVNPDKALDLINWVHNTAKQHGLKTLLSQALFLSSDICNSEGNYKKSLADITNALTLFEILNDEEGSQKGFELLGKIHRNLSDYTASIDMFRKSLSMVSGPDADRKKADLLKQIGNIYTKISDYHNALENYQQSLDIIRKLQDVTAEAGLLNNIGTVHWHLGNNQQALNFLNESLNLKQQLNDPLSEANTYNNIGLVYESSGRYPKALEYYQKSLLLIRDAGDEYAQAGILINIGVVYQQIGDFSKALDHFLKSLDITRRIGDLHGETEILNNIGTVCLETGDYSSALEYLKKSLKIWQDIDDKHGEAVTLKGIGGVYFRMEKYHSALGCYSQILPIAEEAGDTHTIANTYNDIGDVHRKLDNYPEALENYQKCLDIARKIDYPKCQSEALLGIGAVYAADGKTEQALVSLHEALRIAEELGAKDYIYKAHYNLSFVYENAGRLQQSLDHLRAFHRVRELVFNEESDRNFKKLQAIHEVETAKHEAEIYRLRTVELVELNRNLNEAIKEKNELMSIAAHDLKNPLTAILMATSHLSKNGDMLNAGKIVDGIKRIDISAERMMAIITQLLSSDAIESGKIILSPAQLNLVDLGMEMVDDYRERALQKQITIHFTSDNPEILIYTDRGATKQVLDNLLSNAVKYSPLGRNIYISVTRNADGATFEIKDEGPGLTKDDKRKLFQKFARLSAKPTNNEQSTGLGLSIAKKLAEKMNGQLRCESEYGKGAVFIADFPLYIQEPLQQKSAG